MAARICVAATIAGLTLAVAGEARAIGAAEEPLEVASWSRASSVYAIAQTPDGFLWIGTQAGVSRFDGDRFVDFETHVAPGAGNNHARVLLAARDGSLWIGTGAGFVGADDRDRPPSLTLSWGTPGLVRMSRRSLARIGEHELPSQWIWALAEDTAGTIWIGTAKGLRTWREGKIDRAPLRGSGGELPDSLVTALYAHGDGSVSVGTGRGLVRIRAGRVEATPLSQPVLALAEDRAGRVWVSTPKNLVRLGPDGMRETPTEKPVLALLVDRDDRLWAGGEGGLAVAVEAPDGTLTLAPRLDGRVVAVAEDREGSLWVGTRTRGLSQLRVPRLRNIGPKEGLSGEMAFAVLAARDKSIWITTTGGGVSRWTKDGIRAFRQGIEVPGHDLRSLAEGRDGSIWISSRQVGLLRFREGRFTRYGVNEGLRSENMQTVFVDREGRLWATWPAGGATRYDGGVPNASGRTFTEADGLCPGSVVAAFTARGQVWLATSAGLALLEGDRGRCYDVKDGLPGLGVLSVHQDDEGTLWLAIAGHPGLVRFRQGKFQSIPPAAGLPASPALNISEDGRGYLWVNSGVGVWRAAKAELADYADGKRKQVDVVLFDARDGMRSQECTSDHPGAAWDARGRLWVPTLAGVTVLHEPESRPRPRGHPIVDRILVEGRPADAAEPQPLVLPRGGGDLELQFTVPTFVAPHRLQFWYRLDGLDKSWVAAEERRGARYSSLGPGDYTFRVRARDTLGWQAGEGAALAVRVPPRFHQTWLFAALCVAGLGAAGVGLHMLRVRQLKARHAAVQAERARIARELHDSLAQGFSAIGLHLDGLRRGLEKGVPITDLLEQTRGVVDLCQAETRRSIWNIRLGTDGPSLQDLLDKAAVSVQRPPGMDLVVRASGPPLALPGFLQHELSRIVQEAVVNAVRHSEAKQVIVDGHYDASGLRVLVRDNGRGRPTDASGPNGDGAAGNGGGAGVLGMRERAGRIGGTLAVSSSPGQGTEVRLSVPEAELKRLSRKQIP